MENLFGDPIRDHFVDVDIHVVAKMLDSLDQVGRHLLLESINRNDIFTFISSVRFSMEVNEHVQAFLSEIGL